MFSDWASKRASKFILKRVLGKFIKEEHYLDRLKVQLGDGTVQLSDLPLNTDYLNQQLGAAAVSVKEGSIGSLSIKIPWKACFDKCEVELDELLLVLVPHSEVNTSGSTKECSTSEVSSKESLQLGAEHLECSKVHEKGVLSYAGVRDGVQMIAKQVERLLLGLRVKIKNLVIAFEQGAETCSTELGFESSSQSQSILVLRVQEIEYGTGLGGDSSENASFHTDDSQGSLMLTRNISFCGARVDLYDVPDNNEQIESLRHIASILTGKAAGIERCDSSVSIIEGNDGGFTGSVQLSIPWKSGCMDIPKVDAEMYLNPIKLRLQLCTIERLIFLLHSFWGHRGTSSKPSIDPQNGQPVGGTVGLGQDGYSSYDCQSESSMNEGMFTSCTESFANMSMSTREEKEKSTLFSDSMFIPNWMQRDELEESINEFFECFDGKSLQTGPANSSLLGLTYSVFSGITAASTLSTGSFLKNSGEQRVEWNLKARLAGFSVILVFEDPNQSQLINSGGSCTISHISTRPPNDLRGSFLPRNNASFASSMESPRVECLQQEAACWDTEKSLLEANFQDLSFTLQVSAEEARFKAGMKHFEIFGYLFDDIAKVSSLGLSNCEECTETNMFPVSCLQSAVEDVLPSFPLSLRIPSMAKKMATTEIKDEKVSCTAVSDISCHEKERICAASKKFVKIHLLTSKSDSNHQLSLICKFANTNCTNSKIRCTSFDVQLQPFILWVDFYIAKRLWHLIEAIENLSSRFNKVSDEEIDGQGSPEKNDSSNGSIMGTVFVSSSRIILCFPKECSKCISPYLLADSFICIDLWKCRTAEKCYSKRLLKQSERFENDCFSSFSSINLNMGDCDVFLASPTMKKDAGCRHGNAGGLSMCSRKVFSICSQNENDYSTIGIRWQNVPETAPRIVETAWGMTNRHFARGTESTRVIGNNLEFIRATTAGASEDADSHTREKMIQNSDLFFFFSLPHAQLDLYGPDHIVIPNLLHDLTAYIFSEANTRTDLYSEGNHNREGHYHASEGFISKKSQLSFLFECEVVDIAIHMEELLDIKASMKKELPGLWTDFSLRVQKFATLSVSNLGGMCDTSYFWLMHEEGLLHGSLNDRMEKSSESDQKFCLLCCKSNVLGRGDGEGTNALASGNAGTTVIHMSHPQQLQSLTTVMIRCSTLVAPGGRLDWLAAVISFFNQSAHNEHEIAETNVHEGHSECRSPHCIVNSFLLELVDVALSYEPFQTLSGARLGVAPYSCTIGNSTEKACAPVACVLAAASVCLSINTKANTVNREYTISFQDVGLLLLDLSKQRNDNQAYDAKSLRAKGYVKIGEEAAMEVVVKINCQDGLLWEVTCREYHILLKTCHDSTEALMHLVLQLQQLIAPDFEESFVHLQTRPSNSKVSSSDANDESFGDTSQFERRDDALNAAKEDVDNHHSYEDALTGLMDDILENAFSSGADFKTTVENGAVLGSRSRGEPHFILNGLLLQEECALDGTASTSVMDVDSKMKDDIPPKPKTGIQMGSMHVSCQENNFSFIEDYYYHESFSRSQRSESKQLRIGESVSPKKTKNTTTGDVVDVRGGWYEDTIVRVLENHISEGSQQNSDRLQGKEDDIYSGLEKFKVSCKSVSRILLKNFSFEWRMIAGSDWPIVNNCDSFPMNGENARNESLCLKVELHGVDFQYDTFPSGGIYASKLAISIHDLLILDDSKNAPWKKVLFDSRLHPRESSAKALKLELEAVKPDPSTPLEEYRLLVKLHPLRIHLDQSQLEFFINFFSQIDSSGAPQADPTSHMLCSRSAAVDANNSRKPNSTEDTLLPFFQKFVIWPFTIHVDYVPRRVNFGALQGGNYAELLNLISWKGIDLHLKHVENAGVYGWTHLLEIVIDEWLEDITQNQVHKLIRGAAPIRPLFAVGSGAAKLISIPAEHYRKDRRLLKGVQKGVIAFLRSISIEALSCGVHLASGAHGILSHTESALGSIPPSFSRPSGECSETVGKCNQPGDACQGLLQACESLTRGLERTAASLISNPIKSYNRGDGAGTAIATAFRATPAAVIAPVSAAAGAVHRVLLGVRNSLDPERRKESEEKYSGPLPALILAD